MQAQCRVSCDSLEVDGLIAAESDELAKLALIRERHRVNSEAVAVSKTLLNEASKLIDHAWHTRKVPRGLTRECGQRMKRDQDEIRALIRRIEAQPSFIAGGLRGALTYAISCVDCTDDRFGCDAMREFIAPAKAQFRDLETLVAKDEKALRAAGTTP